MADEHVIFVYGTLKRGFWNHTIMERAGYTYVGTGLTAEAYALVIGGKFNVPFLFEQDVADGECHRIAGEVYRVSAALLGELDELEGVAHGYYVRRNIAVDVKAGAQPPPRRAGLRRRRGDEGDAAVRQGCWCWLKQDPSPALRAAPRHEAYTAALHDLYVTPPERASGDEDTGYRQAPPAGADQTKAEDEGAWGWLTVTGTLAGFWLLLVCFWFWSLALPVSDPTVAGVI